MKVKLLLSVLLLAMIIACSVYLTQDVLRVKGVVVLGCVERSPQEVTALSGVLFEESIFKVDIAAIKANVEQSPYYEVRDIRILYPDQIKIEVRERRPRAIIQYLGALIVMDEQGFILEVRQELGSIRCPVVSGLKISSYHVGQQVASSDVRQIPVMGMILEEMIAQDCSQMFSEIILTDTEDIRMMTRDGYHIRFGGADDVETKIQYLKNAVPNFAQEGHFGGTFLIETVKSFVYQPPSTQVLPPIDQSDWPAEAGDAIPDEIDNSTEPPEAAEDDNPEDTD